MHYKQTGINNEQYYIKHELTINNNIINPIHEQSVSKKTCSLLVCDTKRNLVVKFSHSSFRVALKRSEVVRKK